MDFGDKIRKLREKEGLSQTELGEKIHVSLRTIQNWENEHRVPSKKSLYLDLANVLHCDVSYLLDDNEAIEKDINKWLKDVDAWFLSGKLSLEDMEEFTNGVKKAYKIAKQKNQEHNWGD